MIIREVNGTITISGGTGFSTIELLQGELKQLIVEPTTSSTQYDITVTNKQSFDIYTEENVKGDHSELISLPTKGAFTITITNASADEDFTFYVILIESHA